ncbi:cystatin-C [Trichomycterus rosablanca]|uniref:cystatin-C n=1 Tax=Trichomycterus rosablanca TaxID=2290929 RepID=UPI002F35D16B
MDLHLILLLSFLSFVNFCQGQEPVVEDVIVPKKVRLLGGWNDVNPNIEEVQVAAKHAVEKFNTKSKAKVFYKLIEVESAKIMVTNMMNYNISATVGKTKCLKPDLVDLDSCDLAAKWLKCKFNVQFNPRNNQYVAKRFSCYK